MMYFLYTLVIRLYVLAIRIFSAFNIKAYKWLQGRKNIFNDIKQEVDIGQKYVWFHTASLGEFEQARPVIESFVEKFPKYKIVLTFFSPSGYEIRHNYDKAAHVFYLPADTPANAEKFLSLINPELVFFVKYEFWFNFIKAINKRNIPLYFFSVKLRPDQYFFKWYGSWFRKNLFKISAIFVQDRVSEQLLEKVNYKNVFMSGDTRFDRVLSVSSQKKSFPEVNAFSGGNFVVIGGSTWQPDEDMLLTLIRKYHNEIKIILAPHEINPVRINDFRVKLPCTSVLFSELTMENAAESRILIIDNIGLLLHLYQYAHIAYIGGGFGKNVHNVLEAAVFGVPVIFGPNYHKFIEIINLIDVGGAFPVNSYSEFESVFQKLFHDQKYRNNCSEICSRFVKNHSGATDSIIRHISVKVN